MKYFWLTTTVFFCLLFTSSIVLAKNAESQSFFATWASGQHVSSYTTRTRFLENEPVYLNGPDPATALCVQDAVYVATLQPEQRFSSTEAYTAFVVSDVIFLLVDHTEVLPVDWQQLHWITRHLQSIMKFKLLVHWLRMLVLLQMFLLLRFPSILILL